MSNKYILKNYTDLSNPLLGTKILSYSDQFFAPAKRMLNQNDPIFKENLFDNHGKWMDGWETRRKRTKGNDYVIIKLGKPGKVRLIDVNTYFFNGNQPEHIQIQGGYSQNNNIKNLKWINLTKKNKVKPNSKNLFKSLTSKTLTHVKLKIYPDGGVARLRLFGDIDLSLNKIVKNKIINFSHLSNGAQIIACSDEHFGNANNILLPGKSINMGNGWETRRRRGEGYDWVIIKLGYLGLITAFEISTHYFKGNYPDSFSIQAFNKNKNISIKNLIKSSTKWYTLKSKTKLKPDDTLKINIMKINYKFNYVKLNIYPDGGISRFKIFGKL